MVNHRQSTWSNIVNTHGQQSSKHIVNNRQNTWSNIIKQHGQQSSKPWSQIIKGLGNTDAWVGCGFEHVSCRMDAETV
jgi:hypothetical protein